MRRHPMYEGAGLRRTRPRDQLRKRSAREPRATNVVTVIVAMVSSSGSASSTSRLDSLRAYSPQAIQHKG